MNLIKLSLILLIFTSTLYANVFKGKIHQPITFKELELNQFEFERSIDHVSLWEVIQDLNIGESNQNISSLYCEENLKKIDDILETYFYSIQIQKIALDCHNLLGHSESVLKHESYLVDLAQLITASGNGKTYESAFWISDIDSAYEFLKMAGFEVIDGEFKLYKDNTYLAVYTREGNIFGEYRYFKLNNFFNNINQTINEEISKEDLEYFEVFDVILKTALGQNQGLITLAYADLTEAQILIAKILLDKAKTFPTLYNEAVYFFKKASDQGSTIAKYNYAYRIFIDKMEEKYTQGHELIVEALSERFLPAMSLAVVVRELKLGIKKDKKSIANMIELIEEVGMPGEYEYLIGAQLINNNFWNNQKLAKKYIEKSIAKEYPAAMILMGDLYNLGISTKKSHRKAFKWYEKASLVDDKGNAFLKIGLSYAQGNGVDTNIKLAFENFVKSGNLGNANGFLNAGKLSYFKEFKQVEFSTSYNYFKKAHDLGNYEATSLLARSLFHGHGVEQDYQKAFVLFKSIEKFGIKDVETYLSVAYLNGLGTEKNINESLKIIRNTIQRSNEYYLNKKNLILANLNLRIFYSNIPDAVTPNDRIVEYLENQISKNDPHALFKLGYLNYMKYEKGMTREYGVELLKKAAKLDVSYAHTQLARYYQWEGEKVLQSQHLKSARDLGEPDAIYDYAIEIFDNNQEKAIEYLIQSAEKNHIHSAKKLADVFFSGKYLEPNYDKAYLYNLKLLHLGVVSVYDVLLKIYSEKHIKEEQFSETLEYIKMLAIKIDSTKMMRTLAQFYTINDLPEYDPQESIKWYIKAYESGDSEAIIDLGKRYLYGLDLDQNFEMAHFFFANATAKSKDYWSNLIDEPGSFWIALILDKGLGVEQDSLLAKNIYESNFFSARNKEAKNNFVVLTCNEKNIKRKTRKQAFKIMNKLSESSRTSLFNLGWMYEHGLCTNKNIKLAISAYQESANQNSPHALYRLHQLHTEGKLLKKDINLANDFLNKSIESSKKIVYHNMISTFLDLPYINNLKLTLSP
ncbi:MAG: hypothetical protein AB8B80_10680 [Marinicellaceae bacterium]